eukprot:COSAG01_NODE_55971_length_321_cov_1.346847_1_plen_95_part_10
MENWWLVYAFEGSHSPAMPLCPTAADMTHRQRNDDEGACAMAVRLGSSWAVAERAVGAGTIGYRQATGAGARALAGVEIPQGLLDGGDAHHAGVA